MEERWLNTVLDQAYARASLRLAFRVTVPVTAKINAVGENFAWEVDVAALEKAVTEAAQAEIAHRRGER